jgi:hypothetical protein
VVISNPGIFVKLQGALEPGESHAEGSSGGGLDGCDVFLYTDNKTAEGSYFLGTVNIRALFELIATWYKLKMQFDFILHVVWIAGTRMIQQGKYLLSSGEQNGIAACGLSSGGMVPLYLSATARSEMLED